MRIAFFGATGYSRKLLLFLLERHFDVCAIFTVPQRRKIRYSKKKVAVCDHGNLREIGAQYGIPTFEIRDGAQDYRAQIRAATPDLILVLGWYFIIPEGAMALAPKGCIGIHASLLPAYAGGSPLVWQIINGERRSGVTLFSFDKGIDTGKIIAQRPFRITKKDNIKTVYEKVAHFSKIILAESLPRIAAGSVYARPQDLRKRSVFPPRSPDDGRIEWSWEAERIYDFIRAQTRPYPGAYTYLGCHKIIIWRAKLFSGRLSRSYPPGAVVAVRRKSFVVAAGAGALTVLEWEGASTVTQGILFSRTVRGHV